MKFIIEMQLSKTEWMPVNDKVYTEIVAADKAKDREQELHPGLNYRLTPIE